MRRFGRWWKDAELDMRVHFVLLCLWAFPGLPISYVLRDSVAWVVFLSVYAVFATHWAGLDAAKPPKPTRK